MEALFPPHNTPEVSQFTLPSLSSCVENTLVCRVLFTVCTWLVMGKDNMVYLSWYFNQTNITYHKTPHHKFVNFLYKTWFGCLDSTMMTTYKVVDQWGQRDKHLDDTKWVQKWWILKCMCTAYVLYACFFCNGLLNYWDIKFWW